MLQPSLVVEQKQQHPVPSSLQQQLLKPELQSSSVHQLYQSCTLWALCCSTTWFRNISQVCPAPQLSSQGLGASLVWLPFLSSEWYFQWYVLEFFVDFFVLLFGPVLVFLILFTLFPPVLFVLFHLYLVNLLMTVYLSLCAHLFGHQFLCAFAQAFHCVSCTVFLTLPLHTSLNWTDF